jgi:transposase-like protein
MMAEEKPPLLDTLRQGEEPAEDPLRALVRWAVHDVMEAEVAERIGAGRSARPEERTAQRNGYRPRTWDTGVGSLELRIPKLRTGSYFPSWLEPRRRAEQALVAVIAEAYLQDVRPWLPNDEQPQTGDGLRINPGRRADG